MLPREDGHGTDLFVRRDLVQEICQDGRIAGVAAGDFDGPDFQCFLVDTDVPLAPDAPFGSAVLAGVPLTFAFH